MTDRDETVRVMAETLHNRPGGCGAWKCADPVGHATAYIYRDTASDVLDALIAAGWGDLLDEQLLTAAEKGRAERAEAEVERLRELWADTHREKRELTTIVVRQRAAIARVEALCDATVGQIYVAKREVRAALRGDQP
jgi:hypothetical protein